MRLQTHKASIAVLSALVLFSSPAIAAAAESAVSFESLSNTATDFLNNIQKSIPALFQEESKVVYAQSAGLGGAGGSITMFYKEVNGIDTGAACPSGWTEAMHGYGPHYLGIIAYDWYQGGSGGTGGGSGFGGNHPPPPESPPVDSPIPEDPPPPPEDPGPTSGDPENPEPPSNEPEDPPPQPPPGEPEKGPITPPTGPHPQYGFNNGKSSIASAVFNKNIFGIETAHAQGATSYYVSGLAIGSDSACSQSDKAMVPFRSYYLNTLYDFDGRMYSEACGINTITGLTECNRCRVCVK